MGLVRRLALLGGVACLLSGTPGCERVGVVSTSIAALRADPRAYDERIVEVSGVVTASVNLIWLRWFSVQDGTGQMWVRTQRAVPQPGRMVVIRGRARQVLAVGQFSVTVIEEPGSLW